MKTLYHGTTFENYNNILKNGFGGVSEVWNCSSLSETYFYDADKSDYEDIEESKEYCIRSAFTSASITAAVQNSKSEKLIVLEIQIDDDLCEDDWSCENMSDVATTVSNDDLINIDITNTYMCDNGYIQSLRLMYIYHLLQSNPYIVKDNFTDLEINICKTLCSSDLNLYDELYNFEWVNL